MTIVARGKYIVPYCESMEKNWRKIMRFDGPARRNDNDDDEEVERT